MDESKVGKSAMDTELTLEGGVRMKIHAGPGLLGGGKKDPEPKFILDGDFSLPGSTAADKVPQLLGDLHQYAVRFFHGAITPELHEAMGLSPFWNSRKKAPPAP